MTFRFLCSKETQLDSDDEDEDFCKKKNNTRSGKSIGQKTFFGMEIKGIKKTLDTIVYRCITIQIKNVMNIKSKIEKLFLFIYIGYICYGLTWKSKEREVNEKKVHIIDYNNGTNEKMWICYFDNNGKNGFSMFFIQVSRFTSVLYLYRESYTALKEVLSHCTIQSWAWLGNQSNENKAIESQTMLSHCNLHTYTLAHFLTHKKKTTQTHTHTWVLLLKAETRQFRKIHLNLSSEADKIAYKTTLAFYVQNPKTTASEQQL